MIAGQYWQVALEVINYRVDTGDSLEELTSTRKSFRWFLECLDP